VDFNEFASKYILETYKDDREFNREQRDILIKSAIDSIVDAKQYHEPRYRQQALPPFLNIKRDPPLQRTMPIECRLLFLHANDPCFWHCRVIALPH
ncbi:MAG: hypothetical protein IJ993_00070, partial [Akkermansia sp.]|nr:hypothetical protein [Akkermansia sp.]